MNTIKINNLVIEMFQFNGIKIINTTNVNKLIKELIEGEIILNGKKIKNKLVISELSKIKDLINFSKNSFLFKKIYDMISNEKIINYNVVDNIVKAINDEAKVNIIGSSDGEIKKIIDLFLQLNENYISKDVFLYFLKNINEIDNDLLILNDISFIKIVDVKTLLNNVNIIIVTNDFRKYIGNSMNELECILLLKENYMYFEILDSDKIINFIEMKTSMILNNDLYNEIINNHYSYESISFFYTIQQII